MRLEAQGMREDLKTIKEARDSLSSCSVSTAFVKLDGGLQMPKRYDRRLEPAVKRIDSKALLLITPEGIKAAVRLLRNEENRRAFFADLRTLIAEERFDGVHLEFTQLPPVARSAFLAFIRELSVRLKQMRGLLYVAVPPHVEDDPESPLYGAFDVAMIAQYADRVVWNVEESYGGPDSAPMALAPLHLIRRSLDYALNAMPAQKLLLGLPFYGYDWPKEREDSLPSLMLHGFAGRQSKEEHMVPERVHWDELAMSPMYTYRDKAGQLREVWYEDVRSVAAKLNLVHELGLAGVSCRVFENEWSVQWSLLADTFHIEKGNPLRKKHLS
jgi:spore germination protein